MDIPDEGLGVAVGCGFDVGFGVEDGILEGIRVGEAVGGRYAVGAGLEVGGTAEVGAGGMVGAKKGLGVMGGVDRIAGGLYNEASKPRKSCLRTKVLIFPDWVTRMSARNMARYMRSLWLFMFRGSLVQVLAACPRLFIT